MSKKEKIMSLNVGNVTWFFFNVYGLKIKRSKNWRQFLFEDATIANPEDVKEYLVKDLNIKNEFILTFSDADSYLIIHIGGEIQQNVDEKKAEARKRADEIISMIYFVFLYLTNYNFGISLDYELFHVTGGGNFYLSGNTRFSLQSDHTKGEYSISSPEKPYLMSRNLLIKILNKKLFRSLSDIIISKENRFYRFLGDSLIFFYKTTNTPSPIMQFIGAVTSIEILLKDEQKYIEIYNRIFVLLDEEFHKSFIEKSDTQSGIFDLRHRIIHEGKFCNGNDAWRAIRLSTCCLIAFTNICDNFSSKEEICNCLDILFKYSKNNHKNFSKDTFKLLNKWKTIKFDTSNLDWIILHLLSYYGINNSDIKADSNLKIAKMVYNYHKLRNISIESAFHLLSSFIIYDSIKYKNFREFNNYLNINIKMIEDDFNTFNRYNKLEGTGY